MINNKDTFYFNTYDVCSLSDLEWTNDINKHNTKYMQLKDIEVIDTTIIDELINDNYNFWITVVNDNPHFNNDCYLVNITLTYINKSFTVYLNKEYLNKLTNNEPEVIEEETQTIIEPSNNETYYTVKQTSFINHSEAIQYCYDNDFDPEIMLTQNEINKHEIKSIYWYEYTLRGFSPGCQPKGFIEYDPTIGRYGLIAYDRVLTDSEINDYDLKLHHATYKAA